jgi:hypothetical protein
VRDHIGNQPSGIARFEYFFIGHDQAHAATGVDLRAPGTQAVTLDHTAGTATGCSPTTGLNRLDTLFLSLIAQAGYGVGGVVHRWQHRQTGKLDTNGTRQGNKGQQFIRAAGASLYRTGRLPYNSPPLNA